MLQSVQRITPRNADENHMGTKPWSGDTPPHRHPIYSLVYIRDALMLSDVSLYVNMGSIRSQSYKLYLSRKENGNPYRTDYQTWKLVWTSRVLDFLLRRLLLSSCSLFNIQTNILHKLKVKKYISIRHSAMFLKSDIESICQYAAVVGSSIMLAHICACHFACSFSNRNYQCSEHFVPRFVSIREVAHHHQNNTARHLLKIFIGILQTPNVSDSPKTLPLPSG